MGRIRGLGGWGLLALVLPLAVGVLAMHVLGVGHHGGGSAQVTTGHHGSAAAQVTTGHHGAVAASSGHAGPSTTSGAAPAAESTGPADHASAVCLAVLPLLLLLVRPARTRILSLVAEPGAGPAGLAKADGQRAPPWTSPTLSRLCVLRT